MKLSKLLIMVAGLGFSMVDFVQGGGPHLAEVVHQGDLINSKADETDPFLTPDGYRMLYVSNAGGTFDIMITAKEDLQEPWKKVQKAPEPFNSDEGDERSPVFARNAKTKVLFWASNRIADTRFKDLKNFDIFERSGTLKPNRVLQISTKQDEMYPSVASQGREFFFSRKTDEGWRIFTSKGPAYGAVGKGELVKEIPAGFTNPVVNPLGLTMYLQGKLENGKTSIFRTTRIRPGRYWGKPKPIINLNHPESKQGDMAPSLDRSGRVLFFASDRPGGQGGLDIYTVAIADLKTD